MAEDIPESPVYPEEAADVPQFDSELSGKMGDLWLDGSVKFIGGTSNLIWMQDTRDEHRNSLSSPSSQTAVVKPKEEAILSWTSVIEDKGLILHFINMYFCWHYAYFTTLSKELFYRDFLTGTSSEYCSSLLVNVMMALGCHFSSKPAARADPRDSGTTGNHFFAEAKRLLHEDEEFANAKLCTVQALALMSVREAGCGRESKGWVYSGMSFRMACDLGLNVDAPAMNQSSRLSPEDVDARRITFWGCFLFDKCWSNYLGRQPQLQSVNITVNKPEVFPSEESELWSPFTDAGIVQANAQPARTRAVALQISKLAEISGDLLVSFYHPQQLDKPLGKQAELKKLSDIHTRLESWKQDLPAELDAKDAQLPQVLLMHMFYQLLYIHLYRPFLKYTRSTSPLPAHVSPRKYCTQAAGTISKLFRLYKRTHGLRQICNIAIYIVHTACTIHLLNLPDKNARRDIVHGVKHLEEMGDCWTAARRTLRILNLCAEKWKVDMPEEAEAAFARGRLRWGTGDTSPSSPTGLKNLASTIGNPPMSELMARNVLQEQRVSDELHRQAMFHRSNTMTQPQPGLSAGLIPSPIDSPETRRSSGNMSLPPQSAADLNRNTNKLRGSTRLTQAQQDAWNAHQARLRMNGAAGNGSSSTKSNGQASKLFGGVDSLMEESQDWWFKDQSSLATGFENWNAPEQDWFGFDNTMGGTGPGADMPVMDNTTFDMYGNSNYADGMTAYNGPIDGVVKHTTNTGNVTMNGNGIRNGSGTGHNRVMSYDEDMFY